MPRKAYRPLVLGGDGDVLASLPAGEGELHRLVCRIQRAVSRFASQVARRHSGRRLQSLSNAAAAPILRC